MILMISEFWKLQIDYFRCDEFESEDALVEKNIKKSSEKNKDNSKQKGEKKRVKN